MEETLFDTNGSAVAYIAYNDERTIYMWDGTPVGYIENKDEIFGFNGKHIGWYDAGILRDLNGEQVGYNQKSSPVYTKYEPYKAYKKYKPYKSYKEYSKYRPYDRNTTSSIHLSSFLEKGGK